MANSTLWVFVITKLPDLDPIHSASSIKGLSRVNTVTSRYLLYSKYEGKSRDKEQLQTGFQLGLVLHSSRNRRHS